MTRASSHPTIPLAVLAMLLAGTLAPGAAAQLLDEERARRLYVSDDHEDHTPGDDHARDIAMKAQIDRRYAEASRGVMQFQKVTYRSPIGDLEDSWSRTWAFFERHLRPGFDPSRVTTSTGSGASGR